MKKIIFTLSLILLLGSYSFVNAQVARTSWSFGFGLDYPSFFSTDVKPASANFGGFVSLQHNFYENVALRLLGNFNRMEGTLPSNNIYFNSNGSVASSSTKMHTNIFGANLDLLYYFAPCNRVSPYIAFGFGAASFKADWGNVVNPSAVSKTTLQTNILFGSEWRLSKDWNLKTELGYHSLDGQLDGVINNYRKGIFGSDADSYVTLNLGVQYYFSKGEPSKYCDLYSGITVKAPEQTAPTIEQIEEMIKRHIPKEVTKEVVVEKPVPSSKQNWVLFGVNFASGKTSLKAEAYPILEHAVDVLRENQDLKVEIQGYTDNVGKPAFNQKLSLERANAVKQYLVKNGIAGSRLTTVGLGEKDPIGNNSTEEGRAQNRRIEFKVIK